jgi:DNA-binding GntR family transcriptional regulator
MEPAVISTTSSLGRIERSALVDDVYERLKAWVMDDVRDAGVRVNIDAMARTLGVSQTPVREALVRLEAEGFVVKEPARGYTVTAPLSDGEVADLFQFRELIEPWAASRAAGRAGVAEVGALRAELASCPKAPAGDSYATYRAIAEHDARFHDLVLAIAGNEQVRRSFAHTHCHLHLRRPPRPGRATARGACSLLEHHQQLDREGDEDRQPAQQRGDDQSAGAHAGEP